MQTIDMNDQVSATFETTFETAFESCAEYRGAGDGSPVCEACGWLEGEHESPGAEVRVLRTRPRRASAVPKRLAS